MDTSNSINDVGFLEGTEKKSLADIRPGSWYRVLTDLLGNPALAKVPDLFETIANHMKNRRVVPATVPHGLTKFELGLGINTMACVCPVHESYGGEQLLSNASKFWSHTTAEVLLATRSEKYGHLVSWAMWTLKYRRSVDESKGELEFLTIVTDSTVVWLAEGDSLLGRVANVFERHPHIPLVLLDQVGLRVKPHVEKLRAFADELLVLDHKADNMLRRIKR
ncbi:hypothetical protein A2118_01985 [Candidatus Kaiserbacteria bacterium GWA2_50_9]|uniref:Uncharacterized protein n=1 Tax=Candidatus Kaiserbacteria bacterium GWA2_50_9 TaxID=1798474 RepID=A0A1F6BUK7_9BACT|nr:MAG: hypothetical protein A2118_01985 [Candidatus Kaiserbacteria bacterium GWA2_50_9]